MFAVIGEGKGVSFLGSKLVHNIGGVLEHLIVRAVVGGTKLLNGVDAAFNGLNSKVDEGRWLLRSSSVSDYAS